MFSVQTTVIALKSYYTLKRGIGIPRPTFMTNVENFSQTLLTGSRYDIILQHKSSLAFNTLNIKITSLLVILHTCGCPYMSRLSSANIQTIVDGYALTITIHTILLKCVIKMILTILAIIHIQSTNLQRRVIIYTNNRFRRTVLYRIHVNNSLSSNVVHLFLRTIKPIDRTGKGCKTSSLNSPMISLQGHVICIERRHLVPLICSTQVNNNIAIHEETAILSTKVSIGREYRPL